MKNYSETLRYLYNLQFSGIKLGLDNITHLLNYLGNPQKSWPAIHLAGTNGKGSTAAFIYAVLRKAGFRTGLYTSPHLVRFNERIRVNDELISDDALVRYTESLRKQIEEVPSTFFEATTAIAFQHFKDQKVDIAVIETGLGGRLDATNLSEPLISVITPISMDHSQFLGNEILQIAREKAGIIKPGVPCITGNQNPDILKIIEKRCIVQDSRFIPINLQDGVTVHETSVYGSCFDFNFGHKQFKDLKIRLAGPHQILNAATAAATATELPEVNIGEEHLRLGLQETFWPARLQIIREEPLTLLDVAHNPGGFEYVLNFLRDQFPERPVKILLGLAKDKDYQSIADILVEYSRDIGLIRHFSDRGLPVEALKKAFSGSKVILTIYETIEDGYRKQNDQINPGEILLIVGSHYLAGEFLQKIQKS